MLQPLPETACRHHTPGGFANSSIAGTLQHIMQVPRRGPARVAAGLPIRHLSYCVPVEVLPSIDAIFPAWRWGPLKRGRPESCDEERYYTRYDVHGYWRLPVCGDGFLAASRDSRPKQPRPPPGACSIYGLARRSAGLAPADQAFGFA